jgi:hypothetical protein
MHVPVIAGVKDLRAFWNNPYPVPRLLLMRWNR